MGGRRRSKHEDERENERRLRTNPVERWSLCLESLGGRCAGRMPRCQGPHCWDCQQRHGSSASSPCCGYCFAYKLHAVFLETVPSFCWGH